MQTKVVGEITNKGRVKI